MIQKDVFYILCKLPSYKDTQYNIYPKQKQNSFTFMFVSILIVLKITFKIRKANTFKEKILKEHKVLLKKEKISYNFLAYVKIKSILNYNLFLPFSHKNQIIHISSVFTFLYETEEGLLHKEYDAIFCVFFYCYYKTIGIKW